MSKRIVIATSLHILAGASCMLGIDACTRFAPVIGPALAYTILAMILYGLAFWALEKL